MDVKYPWLAWARRLESIASTGAYYGSSEFDRERYQEIAEIAHAMLAEIANAPLQQIQNLFSDFATGHVTPKVDVRGAVIADGKILLVREKADGLWTLPGGFADVGLSAAENVVKEIWEEAGLKTTATRLYALRHKAKNDYDPDIRDFYKIFFLCASEDARPPEPGPEVSAAAFFAPDELPPLSRSRVIEADVAAAFSAARNPAAAVLFD